MSVQENDAQLKIDRVNHKDFAANVPHIPLADREDLDDDNANQTHTTHAHCKTNFDEDNNLTPTPRRKHHSPAMATNGSSTGSEENIGGSLTDLVSDFDEKIKQCFKNYTQTTEDIAPVQQRDTEQAMTESQIWWTITGNFGSMLPLDFNQSQIRQRQLTHLNVKRGGNNDSGSASARDSACTDTDDEELARAMDMHVMVGQSPHETHPQTADQVIEEIDEIMQGSAFTHQSSTATDHTMESVDSLYSSLKSPLAFMNSSAFIERNAELDAKLKEAAVLTANRENKDDLEALPYAKLSALQNELESLIQVYNEALVQELALKDEMEFEKELKNNFISLLLAVQNKKRTYLAEKKRKQTNGQLFAAKEKEPQFVTAVIPYSDGRGPPNNATLQALIKILTAVRDDDTKVPTMLTDYILNVLCPSTEGHL